MSSSIFAIFFFLIPTITASSSNTTVYQLLEEYNFPIGLLPKGITNYELDASTGKFSVYLNDTCSYKVDSYELKYKPKITGIIQENKLSNLEGIQVKVLFLWLNIVEVVRDGDELALSVGIASANFPAENFVECPTCGCGFDCNKIEINQFVSSS